MKKLLLFIFTILLVYNQSFAQVTLQVTVNSGTCNTTCTDGFLGGAPEPQWRVNVGGQGWTTYPQAGICYVNPPFMQFFQSYNCSSSYPATLPVCFRTFEDDGSSCTVSESCLTETCQNFTTPAPGSSVTYTITTTGASSGSMVFTIVATGTFLNSSSVDTKTACTSYTWINGITYTSSNSTATYTLTNAAGCDSVVTLNLTVANIANQTVAASPTSVCSGNPSTITVGSTQSGLNYFLRNNANNAIIVGPIAGTGAALNFTTGPLTASKTYNVYATKSGLKSVNALNFTGNAGLKKVSLGSSIWTDNFAGTNKLTVEAWVKRSATGSLHSIIGNYEGSYPFLLRIDGDKVRLFVNSTSFATGATSIAVGTWTHVAATYDGTNINIYVNGVLDGSTPYSGNLISSTNEVKIGGGLSDNTEYFPGDIADVRLWNVARTQAEIAASKDLVLYGNEAGLIANYQFNEGTGTTTANSVNGNLYPGTLVNAPNWVTGPTLTGTICSLGMSTVVTVNVNTISTAPSISPILGSSCPNTSVILTATGGTAGTSSIIYWYTGPAGTGSFLGTGSSIAVSPSSTATYYARREGLCNTTSDATVTVNVTPNNTVSAASATPSLCINTALTNITHTTTGATGIGTAIDLPAGLTANWLANTITISGTSTASGIFNYSIPLTGGCGTFNAAGTITVNESPVANTTHTNVLCNGGSTGSATADVTGGAGAYSYAWSNGAVNATIINLVPGVYTYTVTDANNCVANASTTITEPTLLTSNASVDNSISCNGLTDGTATASATGGTGTYSYAWSDGQVTATAINLGPGVHSYTVTDANNCTVASSVTITEPAILSASFASSLNVACFGTATGDASALVTGGTASYSYLWNNGQTTPTAINLPAGVYSYTVTDANNCTDTAYIAITEPTPLITSVVNSVNVSCNAANDGAATASASGGTSGYFYAWSNGANSATASNLVAGVYTYTVTDANNCAATSTVTITEPAAIDATTSLNAETITATQTSATYQWVDCDNANAPIANETNQSFTATANGNYAVIVTVGGCNEMSACVNIASVGLRDIASINYTVKPNPTSGIFTVTANTSEAMTLKVYDMIGKLIVSQVTTNNTSVIDLSNYENGIYSLTIETANKKTTSRIVLTK